MATGQEIANIYYTLGAKVADGTKGVLDDQILGLEELEEMADQAGLPIGQLRGLVAELVDELEPVAVQAFTDAMQELADTGQDLIPTLQSQIALYSQGAQIEATRAESLSRLQKIEASLKAQLAQTNLTLERRIQIEQQLARAQLGSASGLASAAGAMTRTAKTTREATGTVKAFGDRWGQSTLQIVDAAANIVQAGALSGRSLKGVLVGATSLVGLIGTGGALVTAAGIGAQAIIGIFTKAREEARRTTDEMLADISRLQNAGAFVELQDKLQNIWTGTAEKNFEDGLGFIRSRIAELDASIANRSSDLAGFGIVAELRRLKEQERPLAEAFQRIQKIVLESPVAPAPSRRRAVTIEAQSDEALARDAEKRADANEQLAQSFLEVEQGFGDLVRGVEVGETVITKFDRTVRELTDRFQKLKNPTDAQKAAFADLQKKAADARNTLVSLERTKAADTLRKLQVSMTTTAVDDLRLALEDLQKQLDDMRAQGPIDEARAAEVLAIQNELIRAAQEMEAIDAYIVKLGRDKISNMDAQLALQLLLTQKQEQLTSETGGDEASRRRILSLQAQIATIQAEITRLGGKSSDNTANASDATQQWATYLEDAAGAAFGIVSALTGADSQITRLLGSTQQVLAGFTKIAALAKDAGGIQALFSSGAGIASSLGALGTIVGGGIALVSALRGKGALSPEQQELIRIQKENNQRLKELRGSIEKIPQLAAGGAATAAVRDVALEQDVGSAPFTTRGARPIEAVLADLKKLGVGLEELRAIAAEAGIALSENPTIQQLAQLQEYLRSISLSTLFTGLQGELRKLELAARLDPKAFEGTKLLLERIKILTGANGIPAIAEALAGIDPKAPDYLDQVVKALTDLGLTADSLDIAKLGGLNPEQFLEEIAKLVEAIRNATKPARTAGEQFADAMEFVELQFTLGTGNALERTKKRLQSTIAAFTKAFPEVAKDLDFSSLEGFRTSIQSVLDSFDDDGVLTDEEKALAAALRELLGAFEAAVPPAVELMDALDALTLGFRLLGTDAAGQLKGLADLLGSQFADIGAILADADLLSAEGRAALKTKLQGLVAQLLEGGVTEEEQAILSAIERLFGAIGEVADAEARAREEALRKEQDRRRKILDAADELLALNDITDPKKILEVRLKAFQEAFGDLLQLPAGFAELEGADLDATILALVEKLRAMGDEADLAGVPIEEIIGALLGLESAADDAASDIQSLADLLSQAFSETEFGLALENITDPIERLLRLADAAAGVDDKIRGAIRGLNLSTAEGRAAAEQALIALGKTAADAASRDAILKLLDAIRGVPGATIEDPASAGPASSGRDVRTDTARVAAFSDDFRFAAQLDYSKRTAVAAEGLYALFLSRAPLISAPVLPPQSAAAAALFGGATVAAGVQTGNGLTLVAQVTITGPVYLRDAGDANELLLPAITEGLLQAAGRQFQVAETLAGRQPTRS